MLYKLFNFRNEGLVHFNFLYALCIWGAGGGYGHGKNGFRSFSDSIFNFLRKAKTIAQRTVFLMS